MSFSSKDFGKTRSKLEADIPDRLIHKKVMGETSLDNGFSAERKHPVYVVDVPSQNISMTIGGLEPSQSTNNHRHTYETIIYVLEGEGFSVIEGREIPWKAGDALYVPRWAWHRHQNTSAINRCVYIACENAPQMQNLGVALREEE